MFLQQSEWTSTMMERLVGCRKLIGMLKKNGVVLLMINIFFVCQALAQGKEEFLTDSTAVRVLKGTLLTPEKSGRKTPLVLIIAGSGPTDRNGNGPMIKSDCYKML